MHTLATHTLFSGANNANYNDDPAFRPAGLKKSYIICVSKARQSVTYLTSVQD